MRIQRVAPLLALSGRTVGETAIAELHDRILGGEGNTARAHARAADRYAEVLGQSRGLMMKAGQILSFMSISTPSDSRYGTLYRTALQRLQADAPPMAAGEAEAMVAAELGMTVGRAFAEFDSAPIAAASIGQVHHARLHDGRGVVVKVQYPGIEEIIRADLANIDLLATFVQMARSILPHTPTFDTRALATEMADRIGEELDYRTEAAHQKVFADAYRDHPFIRIPKVVSDRSTARILTTTYADGISCSDAAKHDAALRNQWGEAVFRFTKTSVRRLRLGNADPNPGNFRFHLDGTVSFLDFGCVKYFTLGQVASIVDMEQAGIDKQGSRLRRACLELGLLRPADLPETSDLLRWSEDLWAPMIAPQPFRFDTDMAGTTLSNTLTPLGRNRDVLARMDLPPSFLFYLRMDAGLYAVLAALEAASDWASIMRDIDGIDLPTTEFGRADTEFWALNGRKNDE